MLTDTRPKGTVAERLKTLRAAVGLTRKEIEVNHTIKSQSLISWEKGHRIPKKDKAELLAAMFKIMVYPAQQSGSLREMEKIP